MKLFGLHRKLTNLEVAEAMQSLLSVIGSPRLAEFSRGHLKSADETITKPLWTNFLDAMERALRREGGGVESAAATVLTWYCEGVELAPPPNMRGSLQALTDLAESALVQLLATRKRGEGRKQSYVALAPSLTLPEAMNLNPGLVGLVLAGGDDHELVAAGRLLKIPIVSGVKNAGEFAREGDVVRVDGDAGDVRIVARVVPRAN